MPSCQTSVRKKLKHISRSSRNEVETPACHPSSIESLEGDRSDNLQTPQSWALSRATSSN
nr:MAG TPA: hypothetical protein [Caudoviricetes sp.]